MSDAQQNLTIVNPDTNQLFPSLTVGGRLCVAVVAGRPFAVRVDCRTYTRVEAVLAVDGRDTLTNRPADPSAGGIPGLSMANPWPGEQRFASASSL